MSHSPLQAQTEEVYDDYTYGWLATSQLLSEGGSLSGREKNCCYLNTGDGKFANLSSISGLDFADDGRAVALLDWDHDGAVDLCLANRTGPRLRVMRNNSSVGAFLALHLRGKTGNLDAIGARIELHLKDSETPLIRTIRAGDSYLSQTSKWCFFGLGDAEVNHVIVKWPGHESEKFDGMTFGKHYQLFQGTGTPKLWQPPQLETIVAHPSPKPTIGKADRIWVADRFSVAPMSYLTAEGTSETIPNSSQATLITLWAESCEFCRTELTELVAQHGALKKLDLQTIALCVDDPSAPSLPAPAAKFLKDIQWPFKSGQANPELLDHLDIIQRILVGQRHQMPAPTSFLFDKNAQMAAIYRGPLAVEQLFADCQLLNSSPAVNLAKGVPFQGLWIRHPQAGLATANEIMFEFLNAGYTDTAQTYLGQLIDLKMDDEAQYIAHLNIAAAKLQSRKPIQAESSFRSALALETDSKKAKLGIARAVSAQGRASEAASHYFEILQVDSKNAEAHFAVGRAFAKAGKGKEAIHHLSAASDLNPNDLATLNVLARILAMHPDPLLQDRPRAIILAKQAVKTSNRSDPQSLETLATAFSLQGQLQEAVDTATEALNLLPDDNSPNNLRLQNKIAAWKKQNGL